MCQFGGLGRQRDRGEERRPPTEVLAITSAVPNWPSRSDWSAKPALIRRTSEKVDYTIIDTAPLLPVADGAEVAAMADATLVVHHAGKSTKEQAARSVERLEQVGERPVGVILNMITRSRGNYDYNFGYYYTYRPDRGDRRTRKVMAEPADDLLGYDDDSGEHAAPERGATREPVAVPEGQDNLSTAPNPVEAFAPDLGDQPTGTYHPPGDEPYRPEHADPYRPVQFVPPVPPEQR